MPVPELSSLDMPKELVGELLAKLTAVVMAHDANFRQGNPAIFTAPTDIDGVKIRCVLVLDGRGIRPNNIALPGRDF